MFAKKEKKSTQNFFSNNDKSVFRTPLNKQVEIMVVEQLIHSPEMKIFSNHLYEYKKGVRHLVLYTIAKKFEPLVCARLSAQGIAHVIQPVFGDKHINIYFGTKECIEAISLIAQRPLNMLSAEEDFILGALLGYDLKAQCKRFCKLKQKN